MSLKRMHVKMHDHRDQKTNMFLSTVLWQKPKCKQPEASEATACKVLCVRSKRDGWMELRETNGGVRDRKYMPL